MRMEASRAKQKPTSAVAEAKTSGLFCPRPSESTSGSRSLLSSGASVAQSTHVSGPAGAIAVAVIAGVQGVE